MGITHVGAEFLVRAKVEGTRFDRALTLGRQGMFVSPVQLMKLLKRHGAWRADVPEDEFHGRMFGSPFYADPLVRYLGATHFDTMDYAPYEGATVVHDLNEPIPDALRRQYDAVIDFGTLEHVFNFPVAIKNCMEMVKVGGHFLAATPANNFFGHGFYQFSAELFYRVFSPENGFAVERLLVCEDDVRFSHLLPRRPIAIATRGRWYAVADPAAVHERVVLAGGRPLMMFVRARRVADVPIFRRPPLQSDYVAAWDQGEPAAAPQPQPQPAAAVTAPAPAPATPAAAPAPAGWDGGFSPRWVRLKHLQLHVLPGLLRWVDPLAWWRSRRSRSLANRRNFTPLR